MLAEEDDNVVAEITEAKPSVKGFNFMDERIMNGNWINEPHARTIQNFLRLLAVCHTAIPEVDEETGKVSYEAESPDEAAFVIAARELGFEFYERTQTTISLHEFDPRSGRRVERLASCSCIQFLLCLLLKLEIVIDYFHFWQILQTSKCIRVQ